MRKLGLAVVLLGAFFWPASAKTPSLSKGDYLLHSIKAVADSGRADDPSYVSALMHLHFTQTSHTVDGMGTYCPAGATESFNTYTTTGDNWFPPPMGKRQMIYANDDDPLFNRISPSPTGTQLTGAYFLGFGFVEPTQRDPSGKSGREIVFINPDIDYEINSIKGCKGNDGIRASIQFRDIPAYVCISPAQIKATFPKANSPLPPPPGSTAPMGSESYDYQGLNANVGFVVLPLPGWRALCLISVGIDAKYSFGSLHKYDFGK